MAFRNAASEEEAEKELEKQKVRCFDDALHSIRVLLASAVLRFRCTGLLQ